MENQELRNFVAGVVTEKSLQGIDQSILEQLIDDMTVELENLINKALIN